MGSVYGFVFVWWVQVLFLWPLFVTRTIIVKFYLPYICNTSSSTRQTTVRPLSSRHLAKGCGMAGPAVSHTNEGEWDSVLATPCWRRRLGWEDVTKTNMFPAWMPPPPTDRERKGLQRKAKGYCLWLTGMTVEHLCLSEAVTGVSAGDISWKLNVPRNFPKRIKRLIYVGRHKHSIMNDIWPDIILMESKHGIFFLIWKTKLT